MAEQKNPHCRIGRVRPKAANVTSLMEVRARRLETHCAAHGFPAPNRVLEAWLLANPWFLKDRPLNAFAIAFERSILSERPDEADRLEAVRKEVRSRFPEKFQGASLDG